MMKNDSTPVTPIQIIKISPERLQEYARVPIRVEVKSIFKVDFMDGGLGGMALREVAVEPYVKDYDSYGETPEDWPKKFDIRNWGLFLAKDGERTVGAAAVVFNTNGVDMLENRRDLSVLWDIRVHPDCRGQGIGETLFRYAAEWSRQRGCRQMKIETQNINVPACRLYAKQGCGLGAINWYAYVNNPAVAHEVQLMWYIRL